MRRPINSRLLFVLVLTAALIALPAYTSSARVAQSAAQDFTVNDMLDVVNVNVADLSDDGRWIVATSASLRDRIGVDNYRYGDPTYIAPSVADVWIIDAQSWKSQKLFPDKRQVQSLRWSPDGARLALMVRAGEMFEPMIWERASGKFSKIELPKGKYAAEGNAPQKYIQNSAIMFADRIKTPLLLMSGEQDPNVPARQAMEMYYALRRLGKEVEWVSYTNSGHGMPTTTIEEVKDYHQRILRWYDDHLKGDLKKKAEETKAEGVQR